MDYTKLAPVAHTLLPAPLRKRLTQLVARPMRKRRAEQRAGSLPHAELAPRHIANLKVLPHREALLAVLPQQAVAAEVGVAEGDFSEQILHIARPTTLHLVDAWAGDGRYATLPQVVEARFAREIAAGQIVLHQGYSTDELARFGDGFFDWIYLDTVHDYTTTARELALCLRKVRPDGIIAGHDYTKGSWTTGTRYGVIEAVHEFCMQNEWEMIYLTHESHRHLSFALRALPSRAGKASRRGLDRSDGLEA